MTLHLSLMGVHHRSQEQQQELHEARRAMKEKIKNDWAYPTLPQHTSSGRMPDGSEDTLEKIAGFRLHSPTSHDRPRGIAGEMLGLDFEPVDWRERECSSATDVDEDTTPTATSKQANGDEYKFEGPDSVGEQIADRREARKRRRHGRLEAEIQWNDGLAHWLRRRDAWCSARPAAQVDVLADKTAAEDATSTTESPSSSPRSSTFSAADHSPTPATTPSSTPDIQPAAKTAPLRTTPMDVLIPVAPPILPEHPVRRRLTSNTYPEIYNKIILQGRTPSVPINLATLAKAIVQGWKDNGEWPPKNGPPEKSIGRKKGSNEGSSLRQGVKAVGRVLRLTGTSEVGPSSTNR